MTDALDDSLARLRRAVDDRNRRRSIPSVCVAEAQAQAQAQARAGASMISQAPPRPPSEATAPPRLEPDVNHSWTDLLRRLLGR